MTDLTAMDAQDFPEVAPARPLWLITLADLALLLVGFFVLMQAHQSNDRRAIANALRASFGGEPVADIAPPMPLAAATVSGFAPGSNTLPADAGHIITWARDISRDPRVVLTIVGGVDGSADDVDPATGSPALLAADRARAVAGMIATLLPDTRLSIVADPDSQDHHRRSVLISLGFAGNRQAVAARQSDAVGQKP